MACQRSAVTLLSIPTFTMSRTTPIYADKHRQRHTGPHSQHKQRRSDHRDTHLNQREARKRSAARAMVRSLRAPKIRKAPPPPCPPPRPQLSKRAYARLEAILEQRRLVNPNIYLLAPKYGDSTACRILLNDGSKTNVGSPANKLSGPGQDRQCAAARVGEG